MLNDLSMPSMTQAWSTAGLPQFCHELEDMLLGMDALVEKVTALAAQEEGDFEVGYITSEMPPDPAHPVPAMVLRLGDATCILMVDRFGRGWLISRGATGQTPHLRPIDLGDDVFALGEECSKFLLGQGQSRRRERAGLH